MVKRHNCARCKRHVTKIYEVAKKTGSRREYCADCIETMRNKGAAIAVVDDAHARFVARRKNANAAALGNGSNRQGGDAA